MQQDYKTYYKYLNEQASLKICDLALKLLGEPNFKSASQWRYGTKGSLCIYISGPKQGRFIDFEAGYGGSALDLITKELGLTGKDLCQWLQLGFVEFPKPSQSIWRPITPVPANVPKPDFSKASLSYLVKNRKITEIYPYKNLEGNLLGYVVRLESQDKGIQPKIMPMLTYCENQYGKHSWYWKGFGNQRLPYKAENLKDISKKILIVEGEKTANEAQKIFPHLCAITWSGGAKNAHKTDWSSLKGREVVIWPDNDTAGYSAAQILEKLLFQVNVKSTYTVTLPIKIPPKWDLADPPPKALMAKWLSIFMPLGFQNGYS